LFVVHGRNDTRVPVSEAEQLVAKLKERNVHCELVVYEDEGHGLARLSNRLDAFPGHWHSWTNSSSTLRRRAERQGGNGQPADQFRLLAPASCARRRLADA
jgi:acetyl esterase/lipase